MAQEGIYSEAISAIDELLKEGKEVIVAIDGNSGSGKSTFAARLGSLYDCNIFHMDDFFLSPDQKTEERMRETGGNVDYIRFKYEVLDKLKKNYRFKYQIYDCSLGILTDYINVCPKKLNIVEGVYSMHPTLCDAYDLKIFLGIDAETQRRRILERSGEHMLRRFLDEWIPLENKYFSDMNIVQKCDLIFTSR
ncbi:uridine kinase family protein [Lutispora saccharofermentans]|uniref:Uridine kinase n=1 Tax=Lutispora saccharofermentans TaxID=3024236 RepID=A0ABT1NDG7_9FIRM|nr:uridine kinase [Lutispora saccharofermentans]